MYFAAPLVMFSKPPKASEGAQPKAAACPSCTAKGRIRLAHQSIFS